MTARTAGGQTVSAGDGRPSAPREVEVLILGGGLCGIAAAIGLQDKGIDDYVIVERSDSIGGTWHHNVYPGCACDIPSHVYSFSYAPNPDWSRLFSPQSEIKDYLLNVARDHGLNDKVELHTEVLGAVWDDATHRWAVETDRGAYRARYFVIAPGPLHDAIVPDFPGMEKFTGQKFHSSQWPADLDMTGRRVAVVGTGASALQFVPAIAGDVEHMTVIQRTPSWVMPKPDWNTSALERTLLRRVPGLLQAYRLLVWGPMDVFFLAATRSPRFARATSVISKVHMRMHIKDRATRKALTPDYAPTCKRLGLSNTFYKAMARPNVDLTTSPAAEVTERGIVTADGRTIEADTIIFGTGFHTLPNHPVGERIRGRDGRTLAETWDGNPEAFMGTTMSGFPNSFMMFGPNAGTLSGFVMAEAQTDYLVGAVTAARSEGSTSIDVCAEAQQDFVDEVDGILDKSTFALGGCNSYYLADGGRVAMVWPWSMTALRRRLAKFDASPYERRRLAPAARRDAAPTNAAVADSVPLEGRVTAAN